jgi:hypothetical protein
MPGCGIVLSWAGVAPARWMMSMTLFKLFWSASAAWICWSVGCGFQGVASASRTACVGLPAARSETIDLS